MTVHFSIDSLVVRGGRLFGWGWFMDTERTTTGGELSLRLSDGRTVVVPCIRSGMRADLREAFPQVAHAPSAGFMFHGAFEAPIADASEVEFRFCFFDGTSHAILLQDFPHAYMPLAVGASGASEAVVRAWRKCRDEGVMPALRSARNTLALLRERRRLARLRDALPVRLRGADLVLVLDHAMGGGANRYREELVAKFLREGRTVALVTPILSTLEYTLVVRGDGASPEAFAFEEINSLLGLLASAHLSDIHVNELVSYAAPLDALNWCLERKRQGARLHFHLHDFHAVCPAFTLIGHEGRYCGVPDTAACAHCLPRNAGNALGFDHDRQIPAWRDHWAGFLVECDEIVAFSAASRDILRLAHPVLPPERVAIRPHHSPQPAHREVRCSTELPLAIGVIGHISLPKGAAMVRQMAERARARDLPVRFVVIGTIEGDASAMEAITVLGGYDYAQLPDLVEANGIGMCLLPSICPETYSYVTDEIMEMGLPLAVFGLGAPAERVARYPRGLIIDRVDADTALDAILGFAQDAGIRRTTTMNHEEEL